MGAGPFLARAANGRCPRGAAARPKPFLKKLKAPAQRRGLYFTYNFEGAQRTSGTSEGKNIYHIMSSLSDYLHAVARRCRFRSRNTLDLAAAADLRELSEELDAKANDCRNIECETPVQTASPKDRHGL